MKVIIYIIVCVVLSALAWRVVLLDRVSDTHAKTINVMLDTIERLCARTQFLEGLSTGADNIVAPAWFDDDGNKYYSLQQTFVTLLDPNEINRPLGQRD